jgi:two-component sensor histidine kinase
MPIWRILRVEALAGAHDLLTMDNWRQAKLSGLVQRALQPFSVTYGDRIVVDCGDFPLRPERAQMLALVLHELATNAAKYGALSNETGLVSVTWTPIEGDRLAGMLTWVETGGPANPNERASEAASFNAPWDPIPKSSWIIALPVSSSLWNRPCGDCAAIHRI